MKKIPMRMCVSCRERRSKKELLRVVLSDDGSVVYDPTGKAAGRGAYLCRNTSCIMAELKAHRLSRGLKHNVTDDELRTLADSILALCEEDGSGEE